MFSVRTQCFTADVKTKFCVFDLVKRLNQWQ